MAGESGRFESPPTEIKIEGALPLNLVGVPLTLRDGLVYAGESPILIRTATVQYFRLARAEWRDRLLKIRQAGFDAAEVYVPWNDHEVAPGVFDFVTGRHDLLGFLGLAAEIGLAVVLRPGPYICAEFEGGGLPARLSLLPPGTLRENRSPYIEEALTYWRAVLSTVTPLQADRGGPVLMVQAENEMDYFPGVDADAMVGRLTEEARRVGITVPIFTCAGDRIPESGGNTPGVLPGINVKPPPSGPWEDRYQKLGQELARLGHPLFVVETYRDPAVLRRLVGIGTKILGPYMVTGGVHLGPMNPVNNWAPVPAFLNADYDFRSPVAADGLLRPPYFALRELFATMDLISPFLGRALPLRPSGKRALPPGVYLHTLGNGRERLHVVTEDTGTRREVSFAWRPGRFTLDLPPRDSQFVFEGLTLPDGQHLWSTLEPIADTDRSGDHCLVLTGRPLQQGTVALDRAGPVDVTIPRSGTTEMRLGETWITLRPREAPPREEYLPDPLRNVSCPDPRPSRIVPLRPEIERLHLPPVPGRMPTFTAVPSLEELHWRGIGEALYRFELPAGARYLALSGSDVLFLWADQGPAPAAEAEAAPTFLGAAISGGLLTAWNLPPGTSAITVRAVAWGHSPFEDGRLPSLHMGSRRGLTGPVWAAFAAGSARSDRESLWLAPRQPRSIRRSASMKPDEAHPGRVRAERLLPKAAWALPDHVWDRANLVRSGIPSTKPDPVDRSLRDTPLRLLTTIPGVQPGTRVHVRVPARDAMTVVRLDDEIVARELSGPTLDPHRTGGTLPAGEFVLPWGLLEPGYDHRLTVDLWPLTGHARVSLGRIGLCLFGPQPLPASAPGQGGIVEPLRVPAR